MVLKNNLEHILNERGLKKGWLAKKAGISAAAISNVINCRHNVSLMVALNISRALDIKVEDIFYLEEGEHHEQI